MHLHVDSIFCRLHTKLGLCIASLAAWVDQGRNAGVLAAHPEARSREAPSSLVESTSGLQPARALQARLPLPIPSMTPGFRALDEPTSEVTNHRSSTPKPYEGDQSAGPVSSGDELNMPWHAENDDGLEHMSDDSGDLDSGTSSDMEVQTSVLKLQATWSWVRSSA